MADRLPDRRLSANVSDAAYLAWMKAADEHGVTVAALVEVLAQHLPELLTDALVREARSVAAGRRKRAT